jgi:hypothetical protein
MDMEVNKMIEFTPQQLEFIKGYFDKNSPTFGNAYKSAKNAGFAEEYSQSITSQMPNWLANVVKSPEMVAKAENNLNNLLDDKDKRIKLDVSKFVLTRKGGWSERQEVDITSGGQRITGFNYIKPNETHDKTD